MVKTKKTIVKKFREDSPNMKAIRKYEKEIQALQEKYDKANEEHNWSMRNFYYNQILAKRTNMEILINKCSCNFPNASNSLGY